ncbi:ABC transporter ATP-binding protein [Haloarcula sp. Atlit-47R]|uniref:ABC transporter ATP-binding protein n=1 Tax=Haloarcula sp. Atlit-47R TaxID=2282132 RepID=UPI000EF1D39A|nr:ABC transporter ATP-binding protein [Haloarcula sp. Atlit-47R]RLM48272.1 ABC transporter ATP-binding protein [Haloarcula sp. Atlit-47R]
MNALAVDGLTKTFDGAPAVDDVSLTVEQGKFFSLIGPSGCGKTTTLRMLAGLLTPDSGRVLLNGQDVTDRPARERATNMVFQDLVLFPHMNVAENVGYGLARSGVTEPDRGQRVEDALALVNLTGFGDRDPSDLSGGQRQRVALARALVNDPAILLLDEPLASLDRALREEMQAEFRRIQRDSDTTFLYVTHDQESALSMSDRVAVMRDGRIVNVGPPRQLYTDPQTRFVASFLGDATLLEGDVIRREGADVVVQTGAGPLRANADATSDAVGDAVTVAVRPEAVTLGGDLTGTVTDVAYKGFYEEATVDCGGAELVVRRERNTVAAPDNATSADGGTALPFRVGETVELGVNRAVLVRDERR